MTTIRQALGRGRRVARRLVGSELDHIIPPEIKDDAFYDAIVRVARTPGLRHILEIGASAGAGSTEALVTGIEANPDRPTLHCLEVSVRRYRALLKRYENVPFVQCYNVSSVAITDFPSAADVERSILRDGLGTSRQTKEMLVWRQQDIDYVVTHQIPQSGIRMVKQRHELRTFDLVLIDGSEFTGSVELAEVYGSRFIMLDDIRTFKNHANFRRLSADPSYRLVEAEPSLRNGYAAFERTAATASLS